jgi:hypothetical protein
MSRVINAAGRGYDVDTKSTTVEMNTVNDVKEVKAYVCISAEACAAEGKDMEENAGVEGDGRDYTVRGVRGRSGRKVCEGIEGDKGNEGREREVTGGGGAIGWTRLGQSTCC